MSSRQQFLLPNVTPGSRVRLDTASGSDSAADVVNNLNQAISGAIITADSTGRLASGDIYGPTGVTTLYMKTLDGSGNVTGSAVTLSGVHPTSSGSDPRVDTILANAPTALDTLKEIADTLASDESAATALTTAVGLRGIDVSHGSTAGTARPTSSLPVTWHGTVAPTNAVARDLWYDEANDLVKRYTGSAWVTAGGTSSQAGAVARYVWDAVAAAYATLDFANATVTVLVPAFDGLLLPTDGAPQITGPGTYQVLTIGQYGEADGTTRFFELYDGASSGLDSTGSLSTAGQSKYAGLPSLGAVTVPTDFALDVEHDAAVPSQFTLDVQIIRVA